MTEGLLLWTFVLLLVSINCSVALYPQYFQFFEKTGCFDTNVYTLDSVQNLSTLLDSDKITSVKWRGVWRLDDTNGYLGGSNYGGSCFSWEAGAQDLVSATKLLPTDLDESAILFIKTDMTSEGVVLVTEAEESFSQPSTFKAILFTGLESYTVFEGLGYSGNSSCLAVSPYVVDQGFGWTYFEEDFVVGSVRLGCDVVAKQKNVEATNSAAPISTSTKTSLKMTVLSYTHDQDNSGFSTSQEIQES